jgi:hypothetical protein
MTSSLPLPYHRMQDMYTLLALMADSLKRTQGDNIFCGFQLGRTSGHQGKGSGIQHRESYGAIPRAAGRGVPSMAPATGSWLSSPRVSMRYTRHLAACGPLPS